MVHIIFPWKKGDALHLCLLVLGLSSFLSLTVTANASPWGQQPLAILNIARADIFRAAAEDREFIQTSFQNYTEVGVTSQITVGGKIAYGIQSVAFENTDDVRDGVVDAELFAQRVMYRGEGSIFSAKASYYPSTGTQSAFGLNTPSGRDSAMGAHLLFGKGFERSFLASSVGVIKSFGQDADLKRLIGGTLPR
ncbi:MAG: hypothetical protein AAF603_09690 [Pseudomonadota bacterium]